MAEGEEKKNADQEGKKIAGHSIQKHGGGGAGPSQIGRVQQGKGKFCGAGPAHIGNRVGNQHHDRGEKLHLPEGEPLTPQLGNAEIRDRIEQTILPRVEQHYGAAAASAGEQGFGLGAEYLYVFAPFGFPSFPFS